MTCSVHDASEGQMLCHDARCLLSCLSVLFTAYKINVLKLHLTQEEGERESLEKI